MTSNPTAQRAAIWLLAAAIVVAGAHQAAANSGLPLPRFASLRAAEVNVRTGPGMRYPVEWVFVYRNMPVEIVAEFDTWRKIRDWEGAEGWVHQQMLSGRRTVMIRTGPQPMRREPDENAPVVARIEARVIGRLQQCRESWCRVEVSGFTGWMQRDQFWGVYADEAVR
jgi:SH3-like domain-containing protein